MLSYEELIEIGLNNPNKLAKIIEIEMKKEKLMFKNIKTKTKKAIKLIKKGEL
jgi:hypothetical protein